MMRLVEDSGIPDVVIAVDREVVIGHAKITDDLCPSRIGGDNFRTSMKRTFWLIEINRTRYVWGDRQALVKGLGNRVYLDGERHRNPHRPQLPGEHDCFRSAPTMPVDGHCHSIFLDGCEGTIMVGIEETHNLMKRAFPIVVAKHFCMDSGIAGAKVVRKLHFRVLCVIATNKASNKPNNDNISHCGIRDSRVRARERYLLAPCRGYRC